VGAHTRHEVLLAFKEALQNIVKHAVATEVFLSLKIQEDTLVIRLADNGKGLPLEVGGAEKDGISNMHARLRRVRGHCQVQSREGGGTVVEMQVPLPKSTQTPVH
jgi:signal transduction histidine kinase